MKKETYVCAKCPSPCVLKTITEYAPTVCPFEGCGGAVWVKL